jgi:hypothetical protein
MTFVTREERETLDLQVSPLLTAYRPNDPFSIVRLLNAPFAVPREGEKPILLGGVL